MNSLKSLILVIIAGILLTTCNQSDIEPEFFEVNEFVDPQSDAMLSDLLLNFSGNDPSARFSDQLINETIGQILTNRIVKRISSPDQLGPVYSMPVVKDPHANIKEWLVLEATENGYVGYIIQYEHEGSFDLLNFTGTARVLDLERTIQSEEYFEDGIQTSLESENGRTETTYSNCDCHWETRESEVKSHVDGEPFEEVWLVCNCHEDETIDAGDSMTGGGDSGIGTPIEGGSGPNGGGGSSGGSGGTIGLPSECDGFENPDGTCMSEADSWELNNITKTSAFKNNQCANNAWNDLANSNALYTMIKQFVNNSFDLNLKLELHLENYSCSAGTICRGKTSPTSDGFRITLNASYVQNASSIAVAKTILHEAIHAHLGYYVKVIKGNNGIDIADFPGILDYFRRYGNSDWQHEQMAQHYRDVIINGMKDFDAINNTSHTSTFYNAMSWAGLKGTQAWNNLSSSEQTNIKNTYLPEDTKGGCR